eukprot:TRINITY_DN17100_c0_g1_i2.p1 TRINITY_DN17100_c0_g1~~TRINITY_DN17100_c0_g1_i2.p1  ORF type:complete len:242 (+),score=60.52 TRINITY_DN17100_c0_g1_i2:188-913(+)
MKQAAFDLAALDPSVGEDKAVPFIILENNGNLSYHLIVCTMEEEAIDVIRKISVPISLVCICGQSSTGKSYLFNKAILGKDNAFPIGFSKSYGKQGIWLWKRPLTKDNNSAILLLNLEAASIEMAKELSMLGMLLSSLMIFSSAGSINESGLDAIAPLMDTARKLQAANEDSNHFPSFLWILHDFALQLANSQGDKVTSRQCMEDALKSQKGCSEAVEKRNAIRRLAVSYTHLTLPTKRIV